MRTPSVALAAAALALAACGDGIYTAKGLPPLDGGGSCQQPQRLCPQGCFLPGDPDACGSACSVCGAPANATRACVSTGNDFACDYTCADGLLKCPSGCCRAAALTGGDGHTCAIASAAGAVPGALRCWGADESGQTSGSPHASPALVPFGLVDAGVTVVAAGASHTCAVVAGAVRCWGANGSGQAPATMAAAAGASALTAGARHTCALVGDAVRCWGANDLGQIGSGTPVASGAVAIAAGANHTCARLSTGAVTCWGDAGRSQTGGGSPLGAGSGNLLAAGSQHTCAADSAGLDLLCWGDNSSGQLPLLGNPVSTPTAPLRTGAGGSRPITNGNPVAAMAAGGAHTCVVINAPGAPEHGLSCFGDNAFGQLGQNFLGELLSVGPASVGTSVFAAGASHTCAVFPADGLLYCWGRNQAGQLGDGDANTPPVGTLMKVSGR